MSFTQHLPESVSRLVLTRFICQFATVSQAGVPIDTPLVPFASADLETIDSATGLAYPAKAERLRRNPKCGMLFAGTADEPVVSIAGIGAVRDSDFQANLERYLSEQILTTMLDPARTDYESLTRRAIHYFTRIILAVKPAVVRWWDSPAAMDGPPREWRAAPGTAFPQSDPAPAGRQSKSPWQAGPDWRTLAKGAITRKARGHLSLIDAEGFPLPMPARSVELTRDGFSLVLPRWQPWSSGKASLTFEGIETFIGEAEVGPGRAQFRAERALPLHPLMTDPSEILRPRPETRDTLMARIAKELDRRGLPLPQMPDRAPEPTAGARMRAEVAFAFSGFGGSD